MLDDLDRENRVELSMLGDERFGELAVEIPKLELKSTAVTSWPSCFKVNENAPSPAARSTTFAGEGISLLTRSRTTSCVPTPAIDAGALPFVELSPFEVILI